MHSRQPRHTLRMEPAHYAGLLRVDRSPLVRPPQYDPRDVDGGEVAIRDLAGYDELVAATEVAA